MFIMLKSKFKHSKRPKIMGGGTRGGARSARPPCPPPRPKAYECDKSHFIRCNDEVIASEGKERKEDARRLAAGADEKKHLPQQPKAYMISR